MSISYQSPGIFEETRFEKIHNIIFESAKVASIEVAHEIADLIRKKVDIHTNLIKSIRPHQVFAAGDLADPHGTHKLCLEAILESLRSLKKESFMKDCWLWLYRGAWHEYEPNEIDMAVPMSPAQVRRKRKAIFYHQTQKDGVMFQGSDTREFWVRAEDRNRETADIYRALGLSDYAAIETFKRYFY
jgi:glucosamine-6-phosphate deaminase